MFGYWIFMGLAVAGVIVMRRKEPNRPRPYRAWGYPLTPILFILGVVLLTANSLVKTFWNSFAGLGIIAAGIPIYYFWKSRRKGNAGC
jgi:APA family basic amino acid/polyamine antiporter